jgi:general secretion pathway protein G
LPVACTFFPEKSIANCANGGGSPFAPRSHDQQRFTLKKIIVVVAMLGLLATLIVSKLMSGPEEAKRVTANQDIGIIMQALKLYRRDNGRYPTQEQGLRALTEKPATDPVPKFWKDGGYLQRLPNDPWGNVYQYLDPGVHGEIDVFSYGADARQGGEGEDADVGSWE